MPFDPDLRLAEWRTSLLDTTKRNRLIKFAAGRTGGVNLVRPVAAELWAKLVREGTTFTFPWKQALLGLPPEILNAETLSADFDPQSGNAATEAAEVAREFTVLCERSANLLPTHLLTEFNDRLLAARLTKLFRTAKEASTDHGVTTLFAAFGFLRWFESPDSEEELLSPLLLVPVKLDRETVESAFTLRAEDDDILPNHCLAEMLQTQFRIKMPSGAEAALDADNPECFAAYLNAVRAAVKDTPRWSVVESSALGVFNFQKLAMWEDLGRNADRVKAHPLCRAIAGDNALSLSLPEGLPTANELDRSVPPELVSHILDADSSQQEAIEAVRRGANLVMDGPPGTGKSQTIANMIAEALAAGKTVLFVSEKTAALEVVKRRLDSCSLGDFCLELHSHKANKKLVVAELGRCLELPQAGVPDTTAQLKELAEVRGKLNEFVHELHAVRQPLGWSAFRILGELSGLNHIPGRSRLAIENVATRDTEYVRRGVEILSGLANNRSVVEEPGGHPWRGCKLTTATLGVVDEAKYNLTQLAKAVPAAETATRALGELGVCENPFTVVHWLASEADGARVLATPLFPVECFRTDPKASAEAVITLDSASRAARELAGMLLEFDPSAVRAITDPDSFAGLVPDRERLVGEHPARDRVVTLKRVAASLRTLCEQAATVEKSARDVAALLRLPSVPPFAQLTELALLAERVAKAPAIPKPWWDAGRRAELLVAVARATEEDATAQTARVQLVVKYSPTALAPEASTVAREAAVAAGSMWRWLPWSRWAKVRKQVEAWYAAPPDGATVRADVAALSTYHQHADAARQVATAYTAELFRDTAGKPEWGETLVGLRDVERLTQWKGTAPPKAFESAKLTTAADALSLQATAFTESYLAIQKEFAVADAGAVLAKPPAGVLAWLEAEAVAVEKEAVALGKLVALLAVGKDVAASSVRERAASFRAIVEARAKILAAARVLGEVRSPEVLETVDHSAPAASATKLLAFLTEWNRPVSQQLKVTLTEATAREKLKLALERSSAARPEFDKAWNRVTADLFDANVPVSTNLVLSKTPLADLGKWAADRAADAGRLNEWTGFLKAEADAGTYGLTPIIDEVKGGEFPATSAPDAFRARFYRLRLDALQAEVPVLAAFTTESHERSIARFAELDRLSIRATPLRVRGQLLTNPNRPHDAKGAPDSSELGILIREVNKKRRHLPLRHLFRQIPTILPRLKPCLMMSPLAVSTYLDTPDVAFDLVIFDEASQVRPHDAICAIYRGKQLVVGGDPRQLPPTDFFNRSGDDGDDSEQDSTSAGTAGYESLLDVCSTLKLARKRLRWHYRSRREGLIAFSNRYFYDGRLVTFPSADEATGSAVGFVRVPDGRFKDGVNPVEAKRVAALVMEHAKSSPLRSLGVIAFSQGQQNRILDELEVLRRANRDLEEFFDDGKPDPFFVKNLENVQGDERDAIMLSVGYGPDDTGKVAMRFGPLNRTGGERRLNVAITRARWSMAVVSSMTSADIDLSRTAAEGPKLLKAFLDYAERGPVALAEIITEANQRGADSPFEQDVGDELQRRGLTIHRQVGCGGYLIDMAITDPKQGGKYLLGGQSNRNTKKSPATARDRDRLRQSA